MPLPLHPLFLPIPPSLLIIVSITHPVFTLFFLPLSSSCLHQPLIPFLTLYLSLPLCFSLSVFHLSLKESQRFSFAIYNKQYCSCLSFVSPLFFIFAARTFSFTGKSNIHNSQKTLSHSFYSFLSVVHSHIWSFHHLLSSLFSITSATACHRSSVSPFLSVPLSFSISQNVSEYLDVLGLQLTLTFQLCLPVCLVVYPCEKSTLL